MNPAAQVSNRRLAFVSFALVLLVLVPALTSFLLNVEQRSLISATDRARARLASLRSVAGPVGANRFPPRREEDVREAAATLSSAEQRVQQHSAMLSTIQ